MSEQLLELTIPARSDRLALIRPAIRRAAEHCGFDKEDCNDIVLAVAEACQNIVMHAYGDEQDGEISLMLQRTENGLLIRLVDFAPTLNWVQIHTEPMNSQQPGGLGFHFLREIMDHIEYIQPDAAVGNVVEMTKLRRENT